MKKALGKNLLKKRNKIFCSFRSQQLNIEFINCRNLFTEEEPEQTAKRLQENSITMGKMQELKDKLENLSIQRRGKKLDDGIPIVKDEHPKMRYLSEADNLGELSKRNSFVGFPPGRDCSQSPCVKLIRRMEQEAEETTVPRPRSRLLSCSKASVAALTKARKEAENIIRMQSNLSILVDSEPNPGFRFRRAPLPDIRRSSDDVEKKSEEENLGKNLREKTARSFAIVEEENGVAAAAATTTASICSSRSSIVGLPANDEVEIAYSEIPREGMSTAVTRSSFRVSRYVLDGDERPKTTPGKLESRDVMTGSGTGREFCDLVQDVETHKRMTHVLAPFQTGLPRGTLRTQPGLQEDQKSDPVRNQPKKRASTLLRNPSCREDTPVLLSASALPAVVVTATTIVPSLPFSPDTVVSTSLPSAPSVLSQSHALPPTGFAKKRSRCSQCRKKLNITNTYTCRCGRMFCAVHRYSEVHGCPFDYKEEGRRILQQANPLVAASKLPKI